MDDTISRRAAIDAINKALDRETVVSRWVRKVAVDAVKVLPPAQPSATDTSVGGMIDRQAAIDAVKKNTFRLTFAEEQNCEGRVAWSAYAVSSDVIEGALLELPSAQPKQRWIPCSERLPEARGFYLTTTKDKVVYCDYWNEDNFNRAEMVIAWMPLPEPYKGES